LALQFPSSLDLRRSDPPRSVIKGTESISFLISSSDRGDGNPSAGFGSSINLVKSTSRRLACSAAELFFFTQTLPALRDSFCPFALESPFPFPLLFFSPQTTLSDRHMLGRP